MPLEYILTVSCVVIGLFLAWKYKDISECHNQKMGIPAHIIINSCVGSVYSNNIIVSIPVLVVGKGNRTYNCQYLSGGMSPSMRNWIYKGEIVVVDCKYVKFDKDCPV